MGRYVVRRLLQMVPVFVGTTLLIFVMVYSLPGDPIRALFGDRAIDPVFVAHKRAEFHLDDPLLAQYWHYLTGVFRGDFGTSFSGRPVREEMARAFPVSIRLALMAFGVEVVVGLALGVVAGLGHGRWADRLVLVLTLLVISVPIFVLGFLAQWSFGITWKVASPVVSNPHDLTQLVLPAVVLGSVSLAYVARLTRTSIVENVRADYMRTAVAKGLPRRRVVGVHLLRNSLIPVVTFLGADLGALMGGAVVTEGVFNVPGVGNTLYQAVLQQEGPTVVGVVTVLVLVYLAASLLVDLLYAVLDPRIRYV